MIHAYLEIYLSKAQAILGEAFDYAINCYNISGKNFIKLFLASSISKRMENGEPAYVAGKSGIEIVLDILTETTEQPLYIEPKEHFGRSKEYWIGWAVAHYQWYSGRSFSDIFKVLSFEELEKMYYTLHEADITKFVEVVDSKVKEVLSDTNLKRIRTSYGVTQAELSRRADVSLRSIQMYEQRNKNINKASAETLYSIARVLGCSMEELIEK